ncbi:MAG: UDP-N-acetylmuramoyl-L-alanyl-D-glutamate--2,6-diaminopimelate ligase, partial [Deltaproteobacteria bacterium]|nr:UDP-N-acetylmuramoyl-L-alanyl-D-glutamate--2,6-diaminopimelate ligase [Deltaproteobacteria bacterium]
MRSLSDYLDYLGDEVVAVAGDPALPVGGASNDSRTVAPGFMFVAVSGAGDDGHRYLDQALAAGVRVVVSERAQSLRLPAGVAAIKVRNAYAAAGLVAEVMHGFPARKLELHGVTGTNGKTTTAFLLRDILSGNGAEPVGLIGTVGYDCGTGLETASRTTPDPFALQEMFVRMVENGCRRAVLEVSSHALVQHRLGRARFARALFTNLSGDHLDYHHTMEEYFRAKRRLFHDLLLPGGIAVLNGDDPYGRRLARELFCDRTLTWGRRRHDLDYHLRIVRADLKGQTCQLTGSHEARRLFCPLVGDYNAENLAAAALTARSLGFSWPEIARALARTA